ncbi:DUF2306 domain-containing protein [Massilia antarctica]|uniref:DUF2306 domain-containing protein n=1 Tax=Massilia antarctica TaxID=2765360 RepID=UPI0006BD60D0|nr:DUF2306 domain-containing protein [Massilia sp. H27-R4]MCY0913615.1 DUF2306 domain-containing protein [Massilia sp. H27-R4]CUI06017.1 hypothetical protein BN2497_6811 [Janthinobacterium sp. CG23_2]CUU29803.1 hypothetical protein BN3177_6811 [Janthinobacterium sp. CG23_2]
MNSHTAVSMPRTAPTSTAGAGARRDTVDTALAWSARLWFGVAILGQLLFAWYVALFYGGALAHGDLAQWNKVMPRGYVADDTAGNAAVGMHVLVAVVITVGGALQLLSPLRRLAPVFHRWNGRVYVLLAVASSLVGLYMVWFRGAVGGLAQHMGISGNAVLIVLCAALAVHHARAGRIVLHRRWALRLFLAVSGVWFFRIGLMAWIVANRGPAGFDPVTFQGPFLSFLSFAQYLLPLAVLELYARAQASDSVAARGTMAVVMLGLSAATAAGSAAAAMILWLPHL